MGKADEPNKIIYSMVRVGKAYNNRQVLKDISLSYFYGAKIGVLGLNGSGKSTLLRIMAGVDQEYEGETILAPGYTVGLLEQEPDMVVSGINSGANLGDDVLYSGTVAAAMEGRFLGLPAIAVSLV